MIQQSDQTVNLSAACEQENKYQEIERWRLVLSTPGWLVVMQSLHTEPNSRDPN